MYSMLRSLGILYQPALQSNQIAKTAYLSLHRRTFVGLVYGIALGPEIPGMQIVEAVNAKDWAR